MDYISKDTVRTMIPGIDPYKEKQLIEQEKEAEMEKFTTELDMKTLLNGDEEEEEIDEKVENK